MTCVSSSAAVRSRLCPWLVKLLPVTTEGLTPHHPMCRTLASACSSSQPRRDLHHHSVNTNPQPHTLQTQSGYTNTYSYRRTLKTQSAHSPLFGCQTHPYSGVPLHIPQVDLELEEEEGTAGGGGRRVVVGGGDKWGKTRGDGGGGAGSADTATGDSHSVSESENERSASQILQSLNAEDARRLKIIKLEFDVTEQMNGKVPEVMLDEHWLQALQLDSKSKRLRYYTFLRRNEGLKKAKKRRQETRQLQLADSPLQTPPPREKNTIFFTVRDSTVKKAGNYRLAHAMQFGQPLVFDMDYEQYMRNQDCQNLVFQLLLSYSKNREDRDPFHLIFTNLAQDSRVLRMLQRARLTGPNFMGTMTQHSYLSLFPRDRLVYLSPHASQDLTQVSSEDVYIVGGIVDKTNTQPLSLARAKEQGLRIARFPLDQYLLWGSGSKSLTLDQVTSILLDQRRSGDWNQALRAIPQRKLQM